jgi:hypothetical protein
MRNKADTKEKKHKRKTSGQAEPEKRDHERRKLRKMEFFRLLSS